MQNYKTWNLEPRKHHLGIFRQDFEENYCRIWNKYFQVCQSENDYVKPNKFKLGPKYLLFGYI